MYDRTCKQLIHKASALLNRRSFDENDPLDRHIADAAYIMRVAAEKISAQNKTIQEYERELAAVEDGHE